MNMTGDPNTAVLIPECFDSGRTHENDLTGEHSCVMLKELNTQDSAGQWLPAFWKDFRRRFVSLLSYQFSSFSPTFALNVLQNKNVKDDAPTSLTGVALAAHFTPYDLKRLEMYSRNMVDYHLIMDMVPAVARMFFLKQLSDVSLSAAQSALLLGLGLQHKSVDDLEKEIELPGSQLMGLFNRLIRRVVQYLNTLQEKEVEAEMVAIKDINLEPTTRPLHEDLNEAAKEFQEKHQKDMEKIKDMDLSQYMIRGDDEEWDQVLKKAGHAAVVSIKSDKKRKLEGMGKNEQRQGKKMKKNTAKKGKFGKKT